MVSTTLIQALDYLGDQDASTGLSNWQQVAALVDAHPQERLALLQWVFQHYPGLYDPRLRAGVELRQTDETHFWILVKHLFYAPEANDCLFALEVLDEQHEQHEQRTHLRAMLTAALRLLQTDLHLHKEYLKEVREALNGFMMVGDERGGRHIRASATNIFLIMDQRSLPPR